MDAVDENLFSDYGLHLNSPSFATPNDDIGFVTRVYQGVKEMNYNNIELHRISLGALIIALGMLVDNAIVVVEGILVGLKKGRTKVQAAVN